MDLAHAAEVQGALIPRGEMRLPGLRAFVHSRAAGTVGDDREYGVDGLWTLVSERDLELGPEQAAARYLADVARHRAGSA